MPPVKKIVKEDILSAAANVIHKKGESALTVRNIAKEIGCSTQPLYTEFKNLEQLRMELSDYIRQKYLHFRCSNYKEYAQKFLKFAKEEKELFRFLYLRKRDPGETLLDDANYDTTVELLSRNLEMPLELAKEMHRQMQYRCYGLGVMLATNYRDMSEEEISRELTSFYCIILRHYKAISREEELQYWLNRSRNLIL